jgi:hypothetical protein
MNLEEFKAHVLAQREAKQGEKPCQCYLLQLPKRTNERKTKMAKMKRLLAGNR